MKRRLPLAALLIVLVASFILSGCAPKGDDKIVVATIDGQKVYKSEYLETWKSIQDSYGITQDILDNPDYTDQLNELRIHVLETVVQQNIAEIEMTELGYYDLTEEEHNTIKSQVQTFEDNAVSIKQTEMFEELGDDYTEEEYQAAYDKYLNLVYEEYEIDEGYAEEYYRYTLALSKTEEELIDSTVSEEELKAAFDERVLEDMELFTDVAEYEYYINQGGYEPYYVPEGLRKVRHVLIALDDETVSQISDLRQAGSDEEAEALIETSLLDIVEKATDVLTQLQEGTITFDEAIEQYNEDPGMDSNPEGYQMSVDTTAYIQAFTDAGMALENIGDFSELVGADYGYHIIEYYKDVESGPIDFETVRDAISEEITEEKRNEAWNALLDEWVSKHEIVYFNEEVLETPEPTQEPEAEQAQEDTQE